MLLVGSYQFVSMPEVVSGRFDECLDVRQILESQTSIGKVN